MRLGDEGMHSWKNTCQTELEQVVDVTVGSEIRDYVKIIKKKKKSTQGKCVDRFL